MTKQVKKMYGFKKQENNDDSDIEKLDTESSLLSSTKHNKSN